MACITRMSTLAPPFTIIFGLLFIILSVIASLGNLIATIVFLSPSQRVRSNIILTSLSISDMLVGFILLPITACQVLNIDYIRDCTIDMIRGYFTVLFVGSSVMTLGIVAFDRYILLTRFIKYDKIMCKRNVTCLLICAWIIPALTPALKPIGKYPYLIIGVFIFFGPLAVLGISYFFIAKAVHETEKVLQQQKKANVIMTGEAQQRRDSQKSLKSHLRLAKIVAILITCYFVSITPLNLWIVFDLVNAEEGGLIATRTHQRLYLCSIFAASFNSCLNPVVYVLRNPEFRKGLSRLLRRCSINSLSNYIEPEPTICCTEKPISTVR